MSKRIVITGAGLVTPLGVGRETFFSNLLAGETGITEVKSFDASPFPCRLAAEVKDFNPRDFINVRNLRKMDRNSSLAVAAAGQALGDAGIFIDETNRDRVGIILGVSYGCTDISVKLAETIFTKGPRVANPIVVPNVVMNAPAGHASIELGIRGVNSTVNHNAASAETAIAYAASELRRGRADVILAGGTDVVGEFYYGILVGFRALSGSRGGPEAARPFDESHNGWVLGEGAGVVCLETLEHAQKRGARPWAELLGWGMSASPSPLNDWPTDPRGAALSFKRALRAAGTASEEVDYVSAAANGSPKLDRLEAEALALVFQAGDRGPLISSLKGALGESFSSGGIRTAAAALSIDRGLVPPTLGLEKPMAPLNFVTSTKKEAPLRRVLVNGISAGGTYTTLVLGNIEDK